jgi:hypothetical protein
MEKPASAQTGGAEVHSVWELFFAGKCDMYDETSVYHRYLGMA